MVKRLVFFSHLFIACFARLLHVIIVFGRVMKADSADDQSQRGYLAGYATKHNDVLVIQKQGDWCVFCSRWRDLSEAGKSLLTYESFLYFVFKMLSIYTKFQKLILIRMLS